MRKWRVAYEVDEDDYEPEMTASFTARTSAEIPRLLICLIRSWTLSLSLTVRVLGDENTGERNVIVLLEEDGIL